MAQADATNIERGILETNDRAALASLGNALNALLREVQALQVRGDELQEKVGDEEKAAEGAGVKVGGNVPAAVAPTVDGQNGEELGVLKDEHEEDTEMIN